MTIDERVARFNEEYAALVQRTGVTLIPQEQREQFDGTRWLVRLVVVSALIQDWKPAPVVEEKPA